jgi:heptosyltransferase-2
LPYNTESILRLMADEFDYLYNFDKRIESCALANIIKAKVKKGFILKDGKCAPIDQDAHAKYLTGLFDHISKANTKSYVEEIFDIAGLAYNKERYLLDTPSHTALFPKMKTPVIGLMTGTGPRWAETRMWPEEHWIKLSVELQLKGYSVVLLGGALEHEKNTKIAAKSGAHYFGHFPIKDFVALMNECDLIVTAVTSIMHFAIAFKKKIVLFVNIFPKAEFELYGLGEIVEPPKPCQCYFEPKCSVHQGSSCMKEITVERVMDSVDKLLNQK